MKKLSFAVTIFIITAVAVSCTKSAEDNPTGNWTCHCVIMSSTGQNIVDIPLNGKTKSEATATCSTTQYTYNSGGNTATCTLQ